MKKAFLPFIFLTLILCILFAGCVQNSSPSPATPVPTVTVTTPRQTALPTKSCSLVPGPTQMVPSYQSVMNVTVIRSDCVTEQAARNKPVMGESVTLMGTLKTDRVIVVMTMTSGDQYTVIDDDYPFPMQVQPV
jgi:PBP1b-binding outer membrane lipoprotein LpoB